MGRIVRKWWKTYCKNTFNLKLYLHFSYLRSSKVYIYTIPPNDSGDQMNSTTCGKNSFTLRERIVYVGHTARPKERFLSHKMKFASIFPGQKLNYCIIATNLHPTQALALELSISMLICLFYDIN